MVAAKQPAKISTRRTLSCGVIGGLYKGVGGWQVGLGLLEETVY